MASKVAFGRAWARAASPSGRASGCCAVPAMPRRSSSRHHCSFVSATPGSATRVAARISSWRQPKSAARAGCCAAGREADDVVGAGAEAGRSRGRGQPWPSRPSQASSSRGWSIRPSRLPRDGVLALAADTRRSQPASRRRPGARPRCPARHRRRRPQWSPARRAARRRKGSAPGRASAGAGVAADDTTCARARPRAPSAGR